MCKPCCPGAAQSVWDPSSAGQTVLRPGLPGAQQHWEQPPLQPLGECGAAVGHAPWELQGPVHTDPQPLSLTLLAGPESATATAGNTLPPQELHNFFSEQKPSSEEQSGETVVNSRALLGGGEQARSGKQADWALLPEEVGARCSPAVPPAFLSGYSELLCAGALTLLGTCLTPSGYSSGRPPRAQAGSPFFESQGIFWVTFWFDPMNAAGC